MSAPDNTNRISPAQSSSGRTLIELLSTLGIVAVVTAIAIPLWNPNRMNLLGARRMAIANLRLARTNSITKSLHYQVSFPDTGHVALSGMLEQPVGSGTWVVDTTKVQTSPLPPTTQVAAASLSITIQFNTRGMVANTTTMTAISLTDSFGNTKSFQVWPSGQIHEL